MFTTDNGFEKFVIKDIKHSVVRNQSADQAVVEVLQ